MSISKLDRLQKRIDTLLEWQSCLIYLAEEHLTPFDKWCIRNEVSNEDQLFICKPMHDVQPALVS